MPARLRSLSIRSVLGALFGLSALLLIGFSGVLLHNAWQRGAEATRLAKDAVAVRQLFGAASNMRLERGNALLALGGPAAMQDERVA